jgi:hypothetical protein
MVARSEINETADLYAAMAVLSNYEANTVPSTNITINGITRHPMSVDKLSDSATLEVCVQQQGWIIPSNSLVNGVNKPCTGAPALNLTPVSFTAPEQLAMYLPLNM